MTPDRRLSSALATAAIALAAAGCGGGDDSSSSSTTASTSTTTQAQAPDSGTTEFLGATLSATTAGKPGVVVVAVLPDSKSQLKAGDLIIAVNDKPVASPQELIDAVGKLQLGGRFTLRVVRGSKRFTLTEVQAPHAYLGAQIQDADAEQGALVVAVAKDGPAEDAGVKPDDVIVAVDNSRVRSSQALLAEIAAHDPGDEVTITVMRGSRRLDLHVTLIENPGSAG